MDIDSADSLSCNNTFFSIIIFPTLNLDAENTGDNDCSRATGSARGVGPFL